MTEVFAYIYIGVDPVAFRLGPVAIRWYGIMYVVAIYIATRVAQRFVAFFGADEEELWGVLPWCIGAGVLGGRLYYVVQNRQGYYLAHPQHILAITEGGMAFFGAIGAAAVTIIVYSRRRHVALLPMLDVAAVFAAVGQPIGRIGNIINGDIVGYPTHLPWGFVYTNPHSLAPSSTVAFQPAPVYEIIANLILLLAMWLVLRRWRPPGLATCLYLGGYAVTQFIVFFGRANSVTLLGLKQAQLTALVTFAFAVVVFWLTVGHDHTRQKGPQPNL